LRGDPKFAYAVMMKIRTGIALAASNTLAKGLLIATRYSLVRTQFKTIEGSNSERPIIEYQTH
jgi:hypothetical protein